MISLKDYFFDNFQQNLFYRSKYHDWIFNKISLPDLSIIDEQDAITKFKELVQPYNKDNTPACKTKDIEFIYICFYLNSKGYFIEQFPNYIERPTERYDFSYNVVRDRIIAEERIVGSVAWAMRRQFVNNLSFIKNDNIEMSDDLSNIFITVSTRSADFNSMSLDEKLEAICNSIEYLLKPGNGNNFTVLDYSDTEGYLSDDIVRKYRNKLECFRHNTKEDIQIRSELSDDTKDFLIRYGLLLIDYINKKINND